MKSSEVAPNARVVRILRSPARIRSQGRRSVPSAAVYKAPSKWTVAAAFILAVALHVGSVMWVEMQQEKPPVEADAPLPAHSMEKVFETGTSMSAAGAKIAAD